MDISNIIITPEYEQCFKLINDGAPSIFISGQAGSGKSVLIDLISHKYQHLNIIKVAPTGVAALNINGQTIHSAFRLPFGVITIDKANAVATKLIQKGYSDFFTKMDLLIIDEIPMGRADVLDAIDIIMRRTRFYDYPFGGAQVLFIGDMFQLPPIVTDNDRQIFDPLYPCEYFFGSNVFDELTKFNMFHWVILTSSFRQQDSIFIKILNNIRVNKNIDNAVMALNEYCFNNPSEWEQTEDAIVLSTTNKRALEINTIELDKIDSPTQKFIGFVDGTFDLKSVITPLTLILKVGAKVMFTRNNADQWVNGTIGLITKFDHELGIQVHIPSTDSLVWVERETWENFEYVLDPTTNKLIEQVIGTFNQYPLTLAYAVTIHKSQGLTFDKVHLDLGIRAFAYGQTYVALSRCTSIDGIHLSRPVTKHDILVDQRIVEFYKTLGYEI